MAVSKINEDTIRIAVLSLKSGGNREDIMRLTDVRSATTGAKLVKIAKERLRKEKDDQRKAAAELKQLEVARKKHEALKELNKIDSQDVGKLIENLTKSMVIELERRIPELQNCELKELFLEILDRAAGKPAGE